MPLTLSHSGKGAVYPPGFTAPAGLEVTRISLLFKRHARSGTDVGSWLPVAIGRRFALAWVLDIDLRGGHGRRRGRPGEL